METASVIPHVNQVLKFENLFSSSLNKPKCLLMQRFPPLDKKRNHETILFKNLSLS
jgi:hypothetical protein